MHLDASMFVAPRPALMLKHLEFQQARLYAGIMEDANAWDTPRARGRHGAVVEALPKAAIDYAVAEPAAAADDVAMVPGSAGMMLETSTPWHASTRGRAASS